MLGASAHEVGVGYRYVNESTHEMRYYTPTVSGKLPDTASPYDRDTRSGTEAHAWYIDDRIDIGNWTVTPGMRFEHIESYQDDSLKGTRQQVSYNARCRRLTYFITSPTAGIFMPIQKDRSVPYSTAKLARLCKAAMWNRKKPAPGKSVPATTTAR
jgi:hypothetical protein